MPLLNASDIEFKFIQEIVIDKLIHEENEVQTPFAISPADETRIIDIIEDGSIMSGYASSLYFDLFGQLLLPLGGNGSFPRNSNVSETDSKVFLIYPNPSNDILYIEGLSDNEQIEIYDMHYNKVKVFKNIQKQAIDIASLPEGIYFVKSESKGTIQFIKSKR